jgi:uncharacterized protein (TIGR02679 family)
MMDRERLEALLGSDDIAWLVDRVAVRVARGEVLQGNMVLQTPTAAQREAADRLFGRRSRGASLSVSLSALERLLIDAGVCNSLVEAIEALRPERLEDLRSRADIERAWSAALADCEARSATDPRLTNWLGRIRESGVLARISGRDPQMARKLIADLTKLLACLPADGMPLAQLATQIACDAHALDVGTPHGTLALHLLSAMTDLDLPTDAAARRDAWAAAGVLCDDLSSTVLVLNLRGHPTSLIGRALGIYAEHGEPCRILLRHILREAPTFEGGSAVFVCENPAVVARAAQDLGKRSAPLICVEGQPTTAARLLLDRVRAGGARLRYHGDFDWKGIQIANLLRSRHAVEPWQLSAEDYAAAPKGPPLSGPPVIASWDARLSEVMREDGRAVHEEQLLPSLLMDLSV